MNHLLSIIFVTLLLCLDIFANPTPFQLRDDKSGQIASPRSSKALSDPWYAFSKRQGPGGGGGGGEGAGVGGNGFGGIIGGGGGGGPGNSPDYNASANSCEDSCLCATHVRSIYFINVTSTSISPIYLIRTGWIVHFPAQIRNSLHKSGSEVIDPATYNKNNSDGRTIKRCGWKRLKTFDNLGIQKGKLDVNGTEILALGQPDIVRKVSDVLRVYPYVEITMTLCFIFGPLGTLYSLYKYNGTNKYYKWDAEWINKQKRRRKRLREAERRESLGSKLKKWSEKRRKSTNLAFSPPEIGDARLLQLPAELQLELISYLEYHDLRRLHSSCRFYHCFIPNDKLKAQRSELESQLFKAEQSIALRHNINTQNFTCFSCLQMKPTQDFVSADCNFDYYRHPNFSKIRACAPCQLKKARKSNGVELSLSYGQKIYSCGYCNEQSSIKSVRDQGKLGYRMKDEGWWCGKCYKDNQKLDQVGGLIRFPQIILSLVLFCTSLAGKIPDTFPRLFDL
jgi:hypothetical protein